MQFRYSPSLRFISAVVLFFFMWSFGGLRDVALAAKNGIDPKPQKTISAKKEKRADEDFEDTLKEIGKFTKKARKSKNKKERRAHKKAIKERKSKLQLLENKLKREFTDTEKKLRTKNLPPEILKRHKDFVAEYEGNLGKFKKDLDDYEKAVTDATEDAALERVEKHLTRKKKRKKPQIDFDNLPTRQTKPTDKKPRLKKEDFKAVQQAHLFTPEQGYGLIYPEQQLKETGFHPTSSQDNTVQVASLGPLTGILPPTSESTIISYELPDLNAQDLTPFMVARASDLPTPDHLTETVEVQLTDNIRAKAAELNHDPLKIYEWVRNNIEFVPTWGSIQGADYCLQTMQGNSADTASLLIALLRASNIPARYVHGTIEIPLVKAMNWAGDFTDPMAAINFIASGGIPSTYMLSGGNITGVRLEQIWVEAWIDYFPSRGARHQVGKGDMWVPLDASFKQYNYTQGIDIASAVPFDAQSFVNQLTSTATINEAEGYVTGIDSTLIQQNMQDFQTQVEAHINQNYPDATVGDVLGSKVIIKQNFPYLLGTLPYRKILNGNKQSSMPDNLRHKISFFVGDNDIMSTIAPLNYTNSLPALAGKKITLSYSPATQADEDLISSYLPAPHADGTPIDPSELLILPRNCGHSVKSLY